MNTPYTELAITIIAIYILWATTGKLDAKTIKGKSSAIEFARILSAIGVIYFHIPELPFRHIAYSGLVFFILISALLALRSAENKNIVPYLQTRIKRLLYPWGFWFSAYALANLSIKGRIFSENLNGMEKILLGPHIALWFFPFIFLSTLGLYIFSNKSKEVEYLKTRTVLSALTSFAFLVSASWIRSIKTELPIPNQWIHGLPSIPLALLYYQSSMLNAIPRNIIYLSIPLLIASLPLLSPYKDPGLFTSYTIGTILLSSTLRMDLKLPTTIITLAGFTLGVYVTHPLIISAIRILSPESINPYMIFFTTTISAFIAAILLKKIPFAKEFS
jgi:hypothetical protein